MKKIFNKEVIIGVCVIAALVVLFLGIDFLKGVNVFKAANYYYASYTNVEGLAVSAPVTVNGFKVGQVRSIEYEYDNPGHVLVELSLDRQLKVPEGTKAVLSSDLLGTATIKLEMAQASTDHAVGDKLIGENESGMMDAISNTLLPSVDKIMPQVDTLLTNINKLVGDPALLASLQRLDVITAELQQTAANLAAVSTKINPIVGDVKTITGNVSTMTEDFASLSGQLKNMPVEELMKDLQVTTDNLKQLSAQLNDPKSTIGQLMYSPELYNNINSTVTSLDSLFTDIKKNPKRYVTIKVF